MAKKKEYTCVLLETDEEGITWITFNRPEKRNAMSPTLHIEMEEILFGLETDEETKVIVLTGAGNSWSAGMDLKQYFRETDKDPVGALSRGDGAPPLGDGAAQLVAQAEHRHGQWLLLRRRVRLACGLRHCHRGGQRDLRFIRSELGHYPWRQCQQSLR
jgi:enoyl-CoA hydratase/carnithine racemase